MTYRCKSIAGKSHGNRFPACNPRSHFVHGSKDDAKKEDRLNVCEPAGAERVEVQVVVVPIGTAAHLSRHNKHPGIDGVGSRDTVVGVNTTSLSECDGHRCRSRSRYRSAQRGQPWALQRLLLLTKTMPVGSHKKLGPPPCHDDSTKAITAEDTVE